MGGVGDPVAVLCKLAGRPRFPRDEGRECEVVGEKDDDVRVPRYPSNGGVPGLPLTPDPATAAIPGLLNKLCNLGLGCSPPLPGLAPPPAVICVNDRPDCERYELGR